MKETQEILIKMGFENPNDNVWESKWFGVFILAKDATPEQLASFIYTRGVNKSKQQIMELKEEIIICPECGLIIQDSDELNATAT